MIDPIVRSKVMRARIATALVICVLGACSGRHKVAGVGLGMTVTGLVLTYSADDDRRERTTQDKLGVSLLLLGLVTLFTAAALEETAAKEKARESHAPVRKRQQIVVTRPDPRSAVRAEAWEITKQAQAAARAGDCPKVTELSAKVGGLDPEFYADVFMQDIAIQRCFTGAPAATPASPQPTQPPPTLPPPT
nr:hypothetical protein [Deltaproteobacteria bacterium]